MKDKRLCLMVLFFILIIIFECLPPGVEHVDNEKPVPGSGDTIELNVENIDSQNHLSWEKPVVSNNYQVFRNDGIHGYQIITVDNYESNSCVDKYPPIAVSLTYYLVFNLENGSNITSNQSIPITINNIPVENITASKLQFTDKIELNWKPVSGNQIAYRIYRYNSKKNLNDNSYDAVFNQTLFSFEDTALQNCLSGRVYYYKVSCLQHETEFIPVNSVSGIYFNVVDPFEPNNEQELCKNITSQEENAVIYSIENGVGIDEDRDWYRYQYQGSDQKQSVAVKIKFPQDSILLAKLRLNLVNNISFELNNPENSIVLPLTNNELIFLIDFNVADPGSVIGTYMISAE